MGTLRPFTFLSLAAVAAVLIAGCGDDDDGDATVTGTATATVTGTTAPGETPTTPGGSATPGETETASVTPTEPGIAFETPATTFSRTGEGLEIATLADIRAARNEGFDRVVFEFSGDTVPGYEVSYVEGVTQCGSGEAVELSGATAVSVTMRPAAAHDDAGQGTVPTEVPTEGTAAIREVKSFCDFEGVVGYGIGLGSARPYRVFELDSPPRLVVDFSQ